MKLKIIRSRESSFKKAPLHEKHMYIKSTKNELFVQNVVKSTSLFIKIVGEL